MNKNLMIGSLFGLAILALGYTGLSMFRGEAKSNATKEQVQLAQSLEKVNGDASKLDEATRMKLAQMSQNDPMSTANRYNGGSSVPSGYHVPGR